MRFQHYLYPSHQMTFIQGRIPKEMYVELKKIMKKNALSWPDVFKISLSKFLDEMSKKRTD